MMTLMETASDLGFPWISFVSFVFGSPENDVLLGARKMTILQNNVALPPKRGLPCGLQADDTQPTPGRKVAVIGCHV